MREVDELRPLSAGRLLEIWRAVRLDTEEPLERTLLCNARILAESCFFEGEPAFEDDMAVLKKLTGGQIESLLRCLAEGGMPPAEAVNGAFDRARFDRLRRG